MADEDIQLGTGENDCRQRTRERQRCRTENQHRRTERTEMHDEDHEDKRGGDREDLEQFAKRLALRQILPTHFPRVPPPAVSCPEVLP
jgi:hypothetical protein